MGSTITPRRGIAFGRARVASGHMAALPRRAQTRVVSLITTLATTGSKGKRLPGGCDQVCIAKILAR
jgi:hypothetical protein